jgi:carbon storage regulator
MLILTRRINESIWIGDSKVTVTSIDRRGSVRIGIDAPKDIPIVRDEIKDRAPTQPTQPTKGE